MIERATKCLHRGGKSAITLHAKDSHSGGSAQAFFWSHGAGDIDLPPWWSNFLEHPNPQQIQSNTSQRIPAPSVISSFLSFLYPPKTVEYAQNLAARGLRNDRTARRRPMLWGGRQNFRRGSSKSQINKSIIANQHAKALVSGLVKEEAELAAQAQQEEIGNTQIVTLETPSIQNRNMGINHDEDAEEQDTKISAAEDVRVRTAVNGSADSLQHDQNMKQLKRLKTLREKGIIELDAHKASPYDTDSPKSTQSYDTETSALKEAVNEASSVVSQDGMDTHLDEQARLEFWRSRSTELAEAYQNYLQAVDTANAIPQVEDKFYSTFAYEAPIIQWQFKSTMQTGLAFLTLFMKYLYSTVLPADQALWTERQWSFLLCTTLIYPKNGPQKSQPLVFVNTKIPAGIPGVFSLLDKAFKAGKATLAVGDLLRLAMSRGQIDFINALFRVCKRKNWRNEEMMAGVDAMDTPSLAQNILILIERIEIERRTRPGEAAKVAHSHRAAYLDIIDQLTLRLLQRRLTPEVNVAAYEKAWMILRKFKDINTEHFVLLLNQLVNVDSIDNEELAVFVQFAYKTYFDVRQRPDFQWPEAQVSKFLQKMILVHHPRYLEVFDYYRSTFGYNGKVYKSLLPEFSHTGEAERWQEVYKEVESREELSKPEWFWQLLVAYSKRADIATCRALLDSARKDADHEPDLRSWNAVLHSYIQGDDMAGALEFYQYMKQQSIKPDVSTSMIILRGYSSRGESVLAREQVASIKTKGHELTYEMVERLIYSHLINDDMDGAEQLLYDTSTMDVEGSRVGAWNLVLKDYAHKGKLADLNYVHGLMREYGVKENASTYRFLMLGFCTANLPAMAFRVMSKIMPMHNISPSIGHYNTLMSGLLSRKEYEFALKVYDIAQKEHMKPDAATRSYVMQALCRTYKGVKEGDVEWPEVQSQALAQASKFLEQSLQEDGYRHAVTPSQKMASAAAPLDQAHAALHFDFLIMQYAHMGDQKQVEKLLKQYYDFYAQRYPNQKVVEPPRMLAAIGQHYLKIGNTDGIKKLLEKAIETLKPRVTATGADTTKPDWVLKSRSMLLYPIFRIRMVDLMKRKQHKELEELIQSLTADGWRFPGIIWNLYVRFLAQEGHAELALSYCEKYLIAGFPGWPESMLDDYSPKQKLESSNVGSLTQRTNRPTYEVLCWLAKCYIDYRREYAFSVQRSERIASLWEIAPKTLNAVTYMPRVSDITQGRILRGEKKDPNRKKKYKHTKKQSPHLRL